jgi:hypothetical protein
VLSAPVSSSRSGPVTIQAPGDRVPGGVPPGRSSAPRDRGRQPRLAVRILAWLVALPIALVAVGIPARRAGYLNSQRLLDVIVKHHIGRFVPLLVIVVLWALVAAVLVTVFLDGGRWYMQRRAERSSQAGGGR